MPPSKPPIFCCASSSTFFEASLKAAITMSCSISTSPATSGSILTPVTFFLPSIFTTTMPPPAEASTRISAISSCSFFCICSACFIMACMFPGSFIGLFLQVSHYADLSVGEHLLESPHLGMREGAGGDIVLGRFRDGGDARLRLAQGNLHAHRPSRDFLHRFHDILFVHREGELLG